MNDAEKLAYEALLLALRGSETNAKAFHLDKLEKFIAVVNIRINKAVPEGWEIP
jgi:hypothetical protein